jgi:SAM-dependent methyltransferase
MNTLSQIITKNRTINVYENSGNNIDNITVKSFGDEWKEFSVFDNNVIESLGSEYFDILTSDMVNEKSVIADFGCGSGRYSKYFQGKVAKIYCIDPSDAVLSADNLLGIDENVEIIKSSISDLPFENNFFDFGMSIGVLHHIPDTQQAMKDCVRKVKIGGYFYTYIYYSLDNRGSWFRLLWKLSNLIRLLVSSLPQNIKSLTCSFLAVIIYMPFILLSRLLRDFGVNKKVWSKIPLSAYHNKSFYIIKNDSLDRFGTPLEHRFSKSEIEEMMRNCGIDNIIFSDKMPYWHAVGQKVSHV